MPTMPARSLLAAVIAAAALTAAGCGGGAQTGPGPLRASFGGQRARVDSIVTDLGTTLSSAGPRPDALLSNEFSALGSRAGQEAAAIEELGHPSAYNTRLRDLGSALVAVANGLGHLSTAAAEHQVGAARAQMRALRTDAAQVRGAELMLARDLGLRAR
jgi:hypothetical protein